MDISMTMPRMQAWSPADFGLMFGMWAVMMSHDDALCCPR
jgi:predicted metal-binding membrane protein